MELFKFIPTLEKINFIETYLNKQNKKSEEKKTESKTKDKPTEQKTT